MRQTERKGAHRMDKSQNSLDALKIKARDLLRMLVRQLKDGIFENNPILVQLLGTCPTLAVSTSVVNAIGMGIAATAVLICSNLLISLLRRFIPKQVRIAAFILVISGFVSAVELIMKAYFPALDRSLGVFIPLIVVNCIILARAEMFASKNSPLPSVIDGLAMGVGFSFGLICLAAIRELIGAGTFAGYPVFGADYQPALLFIMPPGAFITLGCLIAFMQKIRTKKPKDLADAEKAAHSIKKAAEKEKRIAEAKSRSENKAADKAEAKERAEQQERETGSGQKETPKADNEAGKETNGLPDTQTASDDQKTKTENPDQTEKSTEEKTGGDLQ